MRGFLTVDRACGLARGGGNLQKAARKHDPRQPEGQQDRRADHEHRQPVALADAPEQIHGISLAVQRRTVGGGVGHQRLDPLLRLKIHKVVPAEEQHRHRHGDKAAVFELQADLCDHPAEQAREKQHKDRDQCQQHNAADERRKAERRHDEINENRGQEHNGRKQQAEQIHA